MISVFIMFSNDRLTQLEATLSCLRDMPEYAQCQKTLVVDGIPSLVVPDFDTISVPRVHDEFIWANMWAAGVCSARYDIILYLDSDRLLPSNYMELLLSNVKEGVFVFTSLHFLMMGDLEVGECKKLLADPRPGVFTEPSYLGKFRYEPRFQNPIPGSGKNVMSGNTAFTKQTFLSLGGIDPWYRGHGAFADTDFHMQAAQAGCQFVDLKVPELHCKHPKLDNNDLELEETGLRLLSLDNFIYYCNKWKLPLSLAESMAFNCGLNDVRKYVRHRLKSLASPAFSKHNR
jgi:hypothetical protein